MATGTPVVVSDTGGFAETVVHGVNGIRVAPGNASELAGQVCTLLGDPELARRLAGRALQDVEEKFSWPSIARRYEAIYQQIVFSPEARRWRREADRLEPSFSGREPASSTVGLPLPLYLSWSVHYVTGWRDTKKPGSSRIDFLSFTGVKICESVIMAGARDRACAR